MAKRIGTADADTLRGSNKDDVLSGLAGNDRLIGRGGDDVLLGGIGLDLLIGGAGNDSYVIDDAREINKSTVDSGIDAVKISVDYTLGVEQEHLILLGTFALNGAGNVKANEVTGNIANNKLSGGAAKPGRCSDWRCARRRHAPLAITTYQDHSDQQACDRVRMRRHKSSTFSFSIM